MAGPLEDLRILDLTHLVTGPFATKLLADFGADVIKVERPGGDPARRLGPFPNDQSHPEKSGTFFYFNSNKRSIGLDLRSTAAGGIFEDLVDWADVVVESLRPGALAGLGFGWDMIHARRPEVPLVSVTNFGQDGPYADFVGSEVVLWGFGGEMYSTGLAGREPVKMYGTAGLVQAGAAASTAILAAAMVGVEQGVGQPVDFAIADALFASADRRHSTVIGFEFSGRKTVRRENEAIGLADGVFPCSDGWVEMHSAARRYERLADMLGNPDWMQDERWLEPGAAMDPLLIEEFNAHLQGWLLDRTKREVWAEGRRARVMCTPLFTTAEIFEDQHFHDRGFFAEAEHSALGELTFPGRPFIMSETPWELRRPAPLFGEHTREILTQLGYGLASIESLIEAGAVEAA
ncbi:MAG TPA: CoA transferase [Dehalococcoidia bacterium]|nr:CoA transferase [Dehalococcoidia bacterium]